MRHYVLNIYPTVFFPRDTPKNLTLQPTVPDRKVLGGAKNSPEYTHKKQATNPSNKTVLPSRLTLTIDVEQR